MNTLPFTSLNTALPSIGPSNHPAPPAAVTVKPMLMKGSSPNVARKSSALVCRKNTPRYVEAPADSIDEERLYRRRDRRRLKYCCQFRDGWLGGSGGVEEGEEAWGVAADVEACRVMRGFLLKDRLAGRSETRFMEGRDRH